MTEKFVKWLFGLVLGGLILMFALPLLGINPDTKRFYSSEAADERERNAHVRGREAATRRALNRQKSE